MGVAANPWHRNGRTATEQLRTTRWRDTAARWRDRQGYRTATTTAEHSDGGRVTARTRRGDWRNFGRKDSRGMEDTAVHVLRDLEGVI